MDKRVPNNFKTLKQRNYLLQAQIVFAELIPRELSIQLNDSN